MQEHIGHFQSLHTTQDGILFQRLRKVIRDSREVCSLELSEESLVGQTTTSQTCRSNPQTTPALEALNHLDGHHFVLSTDTKTILPEQVFPAPFALCSWLRVAHVPFACIHV